MPVMSLHEIREPADLRALSPAELDELAGEIRDFVVQAVAETGGHLGSNLGAVELTLALHRVFDSPVDAILWDTGHQAYVHKIVTGRQNRFDQLRQAGGLSGYPSREESVHDFVENSHASTILSYAYGLAVARDAGTDPRRHIVAVIGDGSMTGGMAYEALNNIGHSGQRVIIVLNDNGRSYAPTISNLTAGPTPLDRAMADHPSLPSRITDRLSHSLTSIRLNPVYVKRQRKLEQFLRELPYVGPQAEKSVEAFKAAVREFLQPPSFFEALGCALRRPDRRPRHRGAGAHLPERDRAVRRRPDPRARPDAEGPRLPAGGGRRREASARRAGVRPRRRSAAGHPVRATRRRSPRGSSKRPRPIHASWRSPRRWPGPTGLIPFENRFPDRFFDVGIAEQHAVTGAAGMAMGGLRPVVAIYSTFLNRAWDQIVYDVALHRLPVVFCLDRAGITGDNGPSHHGVYDLALLAKVPGMRVLAPSSAQELQVMLHDALSWPTKARSRSATPTAPHHRSASTRSASACSRNQLRTRRRLGVHPGDRQAGHVRQPGRSRAGRTRHRRDGVGRAFVRSARPGDDRRRRDAPVRRDVRGRHPRRRHRHDDRRPGARDRPRRVRRRARPARPGSSRRASPTASSPSSASTPTASPRPFAAAARRSPRSEPRQARR